MHLTHNKVCHYNDDSTSISSTKCGLLQLTASPAYATYSKYQATYVTWKSCACIHTHTHALTRKSLLSGDSHSHHLLRHTYSCRAVGSWCTDSTSIEFLVTKSSTVLCGNPFSQETAICSLLSRTSLCKAPREAHEKPPFLLGLIFFLKSLNVLFIC